MKAFTKDAQRNNRILVTDSLFIFDEHVQRMQAAGFEVERLAKLAASKEEMVEALKDKRGYICGGLEKVDADVIRSAAKLEAIAVLASGYTEFLPSYEAATKQGIAIASCPGANARSVAEYSLLLMLASIRGFKGLTTPGESTFYTGRELPSLTLGIIGFGHIGQEFAKLALALGMKVQAYSLHKETVPGVKLVSLPDLLKSSDVVSLHVNKTHGTGVIGGKELAMMRSGAVLISCLFDEAISQKDLHTELLSGRIKLASDSPLPFETIDLPPGSFISANESNAFNTRETLQRMSDRATNSIINLLTTGEDPDLVNPECKEFRGTTR